MGMRLAQVTAILIAIVIALLIAFVLVLSSISPRARARDLGQWAQQNPMIASWFAHLMQPDNPNYSCCGEADAYWADDVETANDGSLVAVITDTRDDAPLHRPHVPVGTRIVVPSNKIKWDKGNPTGHIVIFLTYGQTVICYVQNGGV